MKKCQKKVDFEQILRIFNEGVPFGMGRVPFRRGVPFGRGGDCLIGGAILKSYKPNQMVWVCIVGKSWLCCGVYLCIWKEI